LPDDLATTAIQIIILGHTSATMSPIKIFFAVTSHKSEQLCSCL